jgi:hypothetical protein
MSRAREMKATERLVPLPILCDRVGLIEHVGLHIMSLGSVAPTLSMVLRKR